MRKVVESFSSSSGNDSLVTDLRFLYNERNLVAEFEMKPLHPSSFILHTSYAWGYDLSGTEQGAGGVGGLLFAKTHSTTVQPSSALQVPAYDGNGNITAYLEVATGQVQSRHEYDAFGNELSVDSLLTSPSSIINPPSSPFKFSTKYTDPETALCYYGYRYMSPELGRWLNRDPIGETGGTNLCVFISNNPVNTWDFLGLRMPTPCDDDPGSLACTCYKNPDHIDCKKPEPPKPCCKVCYYTTGHLSATLDCPEVAVRTFHFGPDPDNMLGWPVYCGGKYMSHEGHGDGVKTGCFDVTPDQARAILTEFETREVTQPDSYGALHCNCYQAIADGLIDAVGYDTVNGGSIFNR